MIRKSWAYLSGLVDGDGFIMFTKHKTQKAFKGFSWRMVIGISSTNHQFLERIQHMYGGYLEPKSYMTISGASCYQLRFRLFEIKQILPRIIPFLILKKRRAELALKATRMMGSWLSRKYHNSLEEIYAKMKESD